MIDIRKTDDGLDVGRLIEPGAGPRTAEELAAFRSYVLSRDLYRGRLVSVDGTTTLIAIRIEDGADESSVAADIRRTVSGANLPERVYYAGAPFQLTEISRLMVRDMIYLIPAAVLLIVLTLFASFRSIRGVILPLVSVGISTVWVIGIMALLRIPFSLVTNVIPVVLMATGSAYGIHVVSAFGEVKPSADRVRDSQTALRSVVLPVFLAAITTFAGFLSFVFGSYLGMIREFGLFSALGVLFALLVSLTFVPAVLSFLPARRPRVPGGGPAGRTPGRRHRTVRGEAAPGDHRRRRGDPRPLCRRHALPGARAGPAHLFRARHGHPPFRGDDEAALRRLHHDPGAGAGGHPRARRPAAR